MFEYCQDVSALSKYGFEWMSCYLTTKKHMNLYFSLFTVLGVMASAAPLAMLFGFGGMLAKRSANPVLKTFGVGYTNMVRGIPDIVIFMFVPLAVDMGIELLRHAVLCPSATTPIFQGVNFTPCRAAKFPSSLDAEWFHDTYGFLLAVFAYALVFGAFAANVLDGALKAVPAAQIETAKAYGMTPRQIFRRISVPQMWIYALPGLNNLWVLLVKATPLLFLLGIEDLVYWAQELGKADMKRRALYPHPNWHVYYFGALLLFYLAFTWVSQLGFDRLTKAVSRGMATAGNHEARA